MKKLVIMLGIAAALAACASEPPAPGPVSERFEANPGAGAIYILRARDPVFLAGVPVKLDGQPVASLRRDDYVRVDVPPGQHRIVCGDADTAHVVDMGPGRTAFVETQLRVGWLAPSCTLMSVDDLNGRQRVMAGKRVVPRI